MGVLDFWVFPDMISEGLWFRLVLWPSFNCTFSIASIIFFYRGMHTVTAYSRCGRTMDLYKFRNMSLSIFVNALNMTLLLMCSLKINDLSSDIYKSDWKLHFSARQVCRGMCHVTYTLCTIYCIHKMATRPWDPLYRSIYMNIEARTSL